MWGERREGEEDVGPVVGEWMKVNSGAFGRPKVLDSVLQGTSVSRRCV